MKTHNHFPAVMKTAAAVLAVVTTVLIGIYLHTSNGGVLAAAISCGTTCYHFAMRLLVGHLVPPVKGTSPWFRPRRWEAPLYRFLGVKNWKRRLPTYDPGQFSLKENTAQQVVRNMCGAEVVHEIIILCSFLPLLTVPFFGEFWVFLITSLLSALFDSLFVMAQRYNRPRLERIAQKQMRTT
jgi:hypothetical protein